VTLIDSSVWIAWIRGAEHPAYNRLHRLLEQEIACVAPVIVQEIVQGARTPAALEELEALFTDVPTLFPRYRIHLDAAALYARCRWRGFTIRNANDCLIAALAVEHALPLLAVDRDFDAIASVEPRLTLVHD
jgi:predicted nucleic acid-binding protein